MSNRPNDIINIEISEIENYVCYCVDCPRNEKFTYEINNQNQDIFSALTSQ